MVWTPLLTGYQLLVITTKPAFNSRTSQCTSTRSQHTIGSATTSKVITMLLKICLFQSECCFHGHKSAPLGSFYYTWIYLQDGWQRTAGNLEYKLENLYVMDCIQSILCLLFVGFAFFLLLLYFRFVSEVGVTFRYFQCKCSFQGPLVKKH